MSSMIGYFPQIINSPLKEVYSYLNQLRKGTNMEDIRTLLDDLKNIKILILGDIIIDKYCFSLVKGRAIKDPILSIKPLSEKVYPGGVLAIANHVSNYVNQVNLISLIGDYNNEKKFILKSLNSNINLKYFIKKDSCTTVKKRFINKQRGEKIIKLEYLDDSPIEESLSHEISEYLKIELPKYDIVLVGDFGHGFIDKNIIQVLEKYSKYLAINVQTNSANLGFNYISRYSRFDFATMDLAELQYVMRDRFSHYDKLMLSFSKKYNHKNFLVTLGKNGCAYLKNDKIFYGPILQKGSVDTVGAGDSIFSIISLLEKMGINNYLLPFLSNCIGALAVQIMGNEESILKEELLEMVRRKLDYELE